MQRSSSNSAQRPLAAIILAAGKGTRMNSDLPKVVHQVAGEPMVKWVVEACREVGSKPIVLVIGHGADAVKEVFADDDDDLLYAVQVPQLGTGHAVMQAREAIGRDGLRAGQDDGPAQRPGATDVLILAGDGPLIRAETLRALIETHRRSSAAATLATASIDDPTGYGRIIRDDAGQFTAIVEHRDATAEQLAIREINPSYYLFRADALFDALDRINNRNAKGEYYLTDVFSILLGRGEHIEVVDAVPAGDVLSINTPEQLAQVSRILEARVEQLSDTAAPRRTTA